MGGHFYLCDAVAFEATLCVNPGWAFDSLLLASFRSAETCSAPYGGPLAVRNGRLVYTAQTSLGGTPMGAVKEGIREFCEKLASYVVLESDAPVAITRHGDTVGYYIPVRRKRTEAERAALREAVSRLQKMLEAEGISGEEVIADFKRWRAGRRK